MQLCPIQLPGREERIREPAVTRVSELVAQLVERLDTWLDRPFALYGHSMGAVVSFELVRALRRAGRPAPLHLFVSAHRAPHLPDHGPIMHTLGEAELVRELGRLNGTPVDVLAHAELMALTLPTIRADFELCETYRYAAEAPLDVPITALGGRDDPDVPAASLEAWRQESTGPVTVEIVEGDHFFLRSAPSLVTGRIVRALTAA